MPGAGALRDRVEFARRVEQTADRLGNTEGNFMPQFSVAAEIKARFGGETVMAARLDGTQPVTIRVRQSSRTRQIKTDWKATDARSGTEYNIKSIADPFQDTPQRGAWFDLLCEAGSPA